MADAARKGGNRSGYRILGIDAAWTAEGTSGLAILKLNAGRVDLETVSRSYIEFCSDDLCCWEGTQRGTLPDVGRLLQARGPFDCVVIDMPLSYAPITGRRVADNAISAAYGGRHASTHSPSVDRPGPVSRGLYAALTAAGFPLATVGRAIGIPAQLETYPHPVIIELLGLPVRLPYKVARRRAYWPNHSSVEQLENVTDALARLRAALGEHISGVFHQVPDPARVIAERRPRIVQQLKLIEDVLDAIVCAYVGSRYVCGDATPFGDADAAIWVPLGPGS